LGIGDWGLGIGDWAQSPIPQSPIPNPQKINIIGLFLTYYYNENENLIFIKMNIKNALNINNI